MAWKSLTARSTATSAVAGMWGRAVMVLRDSEACGSPYGGIEGGEGLTRSSRGCAGGLQGSVNARTEEPGVPTDLLPVCSILAMPSAKVP